MTQLTSLFALFCLVLSGCVSSEIAPALQSAAISDSLSLTGEQESFSDEEFAALGDIPVPSLSPKSSELALVSDTKSADTVASDTEIDTAQSAVEAVAVDDSQTNSQTNLAAISPDSNVLIEPSQQASLDTKSEKRKPSLLELWFAKQKEKSKNKAAAKQKTATQLEPVSNSTQEPVFTPEDGSQQVANLISENALPGVKRNSAIFEVGEGVEGITDEQNQIQVASVAGFGRTVNHRGLILQTSRVKVGCFKPELMQILNIVERHYGKKIMVTSGYRSSKRNRRAGGVRNSTHVYCKAADIQVPGVSKWDLAKYLRTVQGRGGVGTYCRTKSVHIDVGTQRDWHHPCRRSKKSNKTKT